MKTEIKKEGNLYIISMNGTVSVETADPLREQLSKALKVGKTDQARSRVLFDLKGLHFVGSSGISNFIHTLKHFNSNQNLDIRYCHVRSEFKRLIDAFDAEATFEICENEVAAMQSFEFGTRPAPKSIGNA